MVVRPSNPCASSSYLRGFALVCCSSLFIVSCGGLTNVLPVAPSRSFAGSISATTTPAAPVPSPAAAPAPSVATAQPISGVVPPVSSGTPPCWADRYPCQVYDFALSTAGAIEVTLSWDGDPRALMAQLYWAGEGLAHEDVAPRTGPSRISFRRPLMEAASYRLRVVSLEPESAVPFSLTITY
jgi:hypothetical protein